jgi:ABC-type antimicrobial peptide transport system permease subunit
MMQIGYITVFVGVTLIGSIVATLIAIPITVLLNAWAFMDWNMAVVWGPVTGDVFVWGFLSGPITALFTAIFPIRRISKLEPVRVIRGLDFEVKPVGRTLLERIAETVSSASYLFRYSARSMSRRKMRTFMICFGITMVSFTCMNTILYIDSIYVSVDMHMEAHSNWDLIVDMRSPVASAQLDNLLQDISGVTSISRFLKVSYFSELGDIGHPFEVLFLEFNGLQTLDVIEGRDVISSDECVLETRIANSENVEIGHVIEMNIDNSTESFTVVGICESIFLAAFLEYDAAPKIGNDSLLTGAFLSLESGSNYDEISTTLSESVMVESVQSYQEAVSGVKGLFVLMEVIMYFLIVMCVAIVFLVVWTTVNISALERIPELSQLEAIGYDQNSLKRLLYGEVLLISTLGTILSVPPAIYFGYVLLPIMYDTLSVMQFFVRPIPLIVSFLIPIVSAVLSATQPAKVLGRIDLPSILRNRNPN